MRPALKLVGISKYLRLPVAAAFATVFFCSLLMAQGEKSLFRYVSEKTGREVYALKNSQRKVMDDKAAKGGWIVQQLGYAYAEQRAGTTALYGLILTELGGSPARVLFTFSETEYKNLTSKKSPKKWKPYFSDSPIVAYVLLDGGENRLGAHYFTTKGAVDDDPRIRFEGGEYEKWKALPNTQYFSGGPSFYIWKDEPTPALITSVFGPVLNIPKGVFLDQSVRPALYENGKNGYEIDASRAFAGPNKPLTLYSKDALSCTPDGCEFNLGWFVMRNQDNGTLSTYGTATVNGKIIGNSLGFKKGERSRSLVLGIPIKYGSNKIVVRLKPYKTADDIDKSNNTFTVEVILKP